MEAGDFPLTQPELDAIFAAVQDSFMAEQRRRNAELRAAVGAR